MIIGMFLEMLGVSLVIPIITLLTQDSILEENSYISGFLSYIGNPSKEQLIMFLMLALVLIYLIKNLFLAFLAWMQTHFAFGLQVSLSQRLFSLYLHQPYTFHLQHNSAQLIRNVQVEVSLFAANAVSPIMNLLTEILVLIGLIALMLMVEPLGTVIVIMILGLSAWGFQYFTKDRITRWGEVRQYHDGMRIQHLHQGLGGAKDVKLLGREKDFLNQFGIHTAESARVNQFQATLKQIPRLWLELLGVIGLTVLVISMLLQNKLIAEILPILGLFTAIAFRLMPSVNRILSAIQQLQYGIPVIQTLNGELNLDELDKAQMAIKKQLIFNNELKINNVSYCYPGKMTAAVNQVSLVIKRGQTVGLVGYTGSGKSTMVDVILGLLSPESGDITIDDQSIKENMRSWQDKIGYVPQTIYLTDDSIRRNVAFGLANEQIDDSLVLAAIEAAQLIEFINELPEGLDAVVGERGIRLSGGQRQRIGIARALYHEPEVLVLDEATSSLDGITESAVMDVINKLSKKITIIMVAHRLTTVRECDEIYLMDRGEIVDNGKYNDLVSRNESFRTMAQ